MGSQDNSVGYLYSLTYSGLMKSDGEVVGAYTDYLRLIRGNPATIDLSRVSFVYPTQALALALYLQNHPQVLLTLPDDPNVANYLSVVTGRTPAGSLCNRTYMVLQKLPKIGEQLDPVTQKISGLCENGEKLGGRDAFNNYLHEMITNIYEHSECNNAFFMLQRYTNRGFVEMCFADDGLSIPGCFRKNGLNGDDSKCLTDAMNGTSTKKGQGERGYGLRTTAKLVINGLKGQFFMVSGQAGINASEDRKELLDFAEKNIYPGTLITLRIPFPKKSLGEEFYKYVE